MIKEALEKLIEKQNLSLEEAHHVASEMIRGDATPAQIGGFLVAMRMKGETVEEITGMAMAMKEQAPKVQVNRGPLVDTCGTGGDNKATFNISTASALVAAGAGAIVAKHGNTSVSSQCGSADVLRALGVNIEASFDTVVRCIEEAGIGFIFAPVFNQAMKHVITPRKELGLRTVFNLLGPLTNPAPLEAQLMGVFAPHLTEPMGEVLLKLGIKRAFIVHAIDGMDEISLSGPTRITEAQAGEEVKSYWFNPQDLGIPQASLADIRGGGPDVNASCINEILSGEKGPRRDIALLNAAFILLASKLVEDVRAGLEKAAVAVDSGRAMEKLKLLKELSWTG